jgi:hypothetical protein
MVIGRAMAVLAVDVFADKMTGTSESVARTPSPAVVARLLLDGARK